MISERREFEKELNSRKKDVWSDIDDIRKAMSTLRLSSRQRHEKWKVQLKQSIAEEKKENFVACQKMRMNLEKEKEQALSDMKLKHERDVAELKRQSDMKLAERMDCLVEKERSFERWIEAKNNDFWTYKVTIESEMESREKEMRESFNEAQESLKTSIKAETQREIQRVEFCIEF